MTRKKLSEWLNTQGYITIPEQIRTVRWNRSDRENGAYPLWIEYKLDGFDSTYFMGCFVNLRQITGMLKDGYELKVALDRWSNYELDLIKIKP